jgi:hypothetical protein
MTPTRPVRAARRVRCESTRDHGLSRRTAHRGGGNDSSEWHSTSDTELVPVQQLGVDRDHPHRSAQIPPLATGQSQLRLARPQASLIVDIRKLGSERWVSASGTAEIIRGERSKEIDTTMGQRYLTQAALEDPRVGPVFAAAGNVTIDLTPQAWRSYDLKSLDDQFCAGLLRHTPEQWFLPLD